LPPTPTAELPPSPSSSLAPASSVAAQSAEAPIIDALLSGLTSGLDHATALTHVQYPRGSRTASPSVCSEPGGAWAAGAHATRSPVAGGAESYGGLASDGEASSEEDEAPLSQRLPAARRSMASSSGAAGRMDGSAVSTRSPSAAEARADQCWVDGRAYDGGGASESADVGADEGDGTGAGAGQGGRGYDEGKRGCPSSWPPPAQAGDSRPAAAPPKAYRIPRGPQSSHRQPLTSSPEASTEATETESRLKANQAEKRLLLESQLGYVTCGCNGCVLKEFHAGECVFPEIPMNRRFRAS